MSNYGLRGFLISFILVFVLTFQSCSSVVTTKYAIISSICLAAISGVIGLLVGKQFKSDDTPPETQFFRKYEKYFYVSLIPLIILVKLYNDNPGISSSEPSQELKDNLGNLDGTWAWESKKAESTYCLRICFDLNTKSGKYDLASLHEDWESEKSKLSKIRSGKFELVNGYDKYGDKAYVGKDTESDKPMFVITLLDNPYASEWHLRLSMIEDEMFGHGMLKINNDCNAATK
ncbi:hypothetical protein SAMN05216327_11893 [Dyadobacter sp. SG02]|uniref:hypothetical protein n=1 Tax=Dyadobacter sp. SG02 TaxID=1855291 RepID=UPI0008AEAC0A|nr:hypothetical protein [Dyadobacter sp. SG02]SEJ75215.1 hypothetical protein SAMN05216327_11893 [Dyadobacter sp. SG02]